MRTDTPRTRRARPRRMLGGLALVITGVLLSGCAARPAGSGEDPVRLTAATPIVAPAPLPTPTPTARPTATPTTMPPFRTASPDPAARSASAAPASAATPARRAKALVDAMSLEQQAGAVLMTAGTVEELRGLRGLVARRRLAGVMVRGRSTGGVRPVRAAVARVRSAAPEGLPLLVATDQEGGTVQVLRGRGFSEIPSAVRQARSSDRTLQTRAAGWGHSMHAAGVDLDLAPVADVPCADTRHDNPPIADLDRNYGLQPRAAGRSVAAVVNGLHRAGVAATLKHFPGLGCVRENTDTAASVVDRETGVTSPRLGTFRAGLTAGAEVVMVSSARYARIDGRSDALFSSRIVRDLLRHRMRFRGVVMTDDVGGARALASVPVGERATRFVAAGGDLVLDIVPAHIPVIVRALATRAHRDPRLAARLRDAATRVTALRLTLHP